MNADEFYERLVAKWQLVFTNKTMQFLDVVDAMSAEGLHEESARYLDQSADHLNSAINCLKKANKNKEEI